MPKKRRRFVSNLEMFPTISGSQNTSYRFIRLCFYLYCGSAVFVVKAEDNERREKNLEEAKKIVIKNDPSLPEAEAVSLSYFTCILAPAPVIKFGFKSD